MRRLWIVLVLLALPSLLLAQQPLVLRLDVHGVIENGLAPYIERGVREAKARGAAAILLDIDTPGGRVDAAQRMTDALRSAIVPVVAYVHPRALSAGAMVALAADAIVMAPGGVIGAATPVDGEGRKAPEKIVSAMRAEFRALAEARGIDPTIAEGMVDETLDIPGLKPKGRLLTLSSAEAIRVGVASKEVATAEEAVATVGVVAPQIVLLEANWAESLARFLTNPVVAPLLLSVGMIGLIFEIKAGAFGLGFVLSLLSLGAFFGANALVGLAGTEELLVLGAGIVALGVEIFVLPGFGIAGLAGLALIGTSAVMAMLGVAPTGGDLVQALGVLAVAVVVTLIVGVAWLRHLPYSTRFGGLLLRGNLHRDQGFISGPTRSDLVGQAGVAQTDLRPSGVAVVGTERLDVVTEGEYVAQGAAVVVVRSEGYRHIVRAGSSS
jgi:membrane-bound serine protease (ClpP class)